MTLSREDRTAINETRLAAKRNRVYYPTSHDLLHRKYAVRRIEAFENLNWAEETIRTLLYADYSQPGFDALRLKLMTYARASLQRSRRNAESAKYLGCALHRI